MAAYYPVFLDLRGRRCLVVGGGEVAHRKAEGLLKAGARVTIVSPTACASLAKMAEAASVVWVKRAYRPGDIKGASVVIAATNDQAVNAAVASEAAAAGVLVNVVDDPALCSFISPAVVERNGLTIAVSTDGKSPALARRVREEIEALFPEEYGMLLEVAAEVRERLLRQGVHPLPDLWQRALSGEVIMLVRQGKREAAQSALLDALGHGALT